MRKKKIYIYIYKEWKSPLVYTPLYYHPHKTHDASPRKNGNLLHYLLLLLLQPAV